MLTTDFRGRIAEHSAAMAGLAAIFAEVRIGTDEHTAAAIIDENFVQIDVGRAAKGAWLGESLDEKRMIVEIETLYGCIGWDGIDAFFAAGAE
jgi:hypothetical protein